VPALLRDLLTLRPDQVFLVAGLAGAYFVASFLAVRHAVREGFPGSWRLLTETEHVELEDLARLCPAVDAMVDEVCRLGRAPALQDLLQARVLGGSRNVAIAWLSGRATPAPMRRKLVVSPVSGLPASAGGGMAANDAPRHRDIAKVPPRTGSSNSSRVDAKVGTVMPKRGPLATFQIRPGAVGVGGASTPAA